MTFKLHFMPYQTEVHQRLSDEKAVSLVLINGIVFIDNVWLNDKARFYPSGYVNNQKSCNSLGFFLTRGRVFEIT